MILKRESAANHEITLDVSGALNDEPASEFQKELEAVVTSEFVTVTL